MGRISSLGFDFDPSAALHFKEKVAEPLPATSCQDPGARKMGLTELILIATHRHVAHLPR